jgi:hypothetical protein
MTIDALALIGVGIGIGIGMERDDMGSLENGAGRRHLEQAMEQRTELDWSRRIEDCSGLEGMTRCVRNTPLVIPDPFLM